MTFKSPRLTHFPVRKVKRSHSFYLWKRWRYLRTSSCAFLAWGVKKRYPIAQGRKLKCDVMILLQCYDQLSDVWLGKKTRGVLLISSRSGCFDWRWGSVRHLPLASSVSLSHCLLSPFDHGKLISTSHPNSPSALRGYVSSCVLLCLSVCVCVKCVQVRSYRQPDSYQELQVCLN